MSEPWGIVVVPTEAGRALTEPGRRMEIPEHGSADRPRLQVTRAARPPEVCWGYDDATRSFPPNGLPLWWAGALVPEGWDRARRVFGWHDWPPDPTQHGGAAYILRMMEVYREDWDSLCRVVLLDLVDGAVVERAP